MHDEREPYSSVLSHYTLRTTHYYYYVVLFRTFALELEL
jgi:hypothetical protein